MISDLSSGRIGLFCLVFVASACTGAGSATTTRVDPPSGLDGTVPPYVQCMIDGGLRVTEAPSANDPGFELESDLPQEEGLEVFKACMELAPEPPPLSDEDIADTYEEWADDAECLRELGYHPTAPPSLDKFIQDYRSPTGPWMPTDGIQTASWSYAEYEHAKAKCGLLFYERG